MVDADETADKRSPSVEPGYSSDEDDVLKQISGDGGGGGGGDGVGDGGGGEDSQDKEGDLAQTTSAAEDPEPPAAAEEEAPSSTAAPPRPQSPERSGSSQPPDPKTKLFVGGINWQCGEADLERVFGTVGEVTEAKVMRMRTEDGGPGKSRGFAFVHVRCLQSTFPAGLTTSPRASLASLDSPPSTTC